MDKRSLIYSEVLLELIDESCVGKAQKEADAVIENYEDQLRSVSNLFRGENSGENSIEAFFSSPLPPPAKKIEFLQLSLKKYLYPLFLNFLCIIFTRNAYFLLPQIEKSFRNLLNKRLARMDFLVKSPSKLSEEEEKGIRSVLENILKKRAVIEFREEPSLLGGLSIAAENFSLDTTLKTKLQNIEHDLKKHKWREEKYYEN